MRREPRSCTGAFAGMAMGSAILKGVTYLLRRAEPENFKAAAQVGRAIPTFYLKRVTCGKPAKGHQQPPGLQILTWVLDAGGYPDVIWERLVPGPGLEPGYSAPKADVLPIRRSRKRCKHRSYIMPQRLLEGQSGQTQQFSCRVLGRNQALYQARSA